MFWKLLKGLVWPVFFLLARAKSIVLLSLQLARASRAEFAHAALERGLENAIKAEPIGHPAPVHVIRRLCLIAIAAQLAALAAVAFTAYWALASDARPIEIANFMVFSAALAIAAAVAAFAVVVARGGKRSFLANLADPIGLLSEPWVSTGRRGG